MDITSRWITGVYVLVLILLMADYGHALVGYRITFKTGTSHDEAGTNAGISVRLYGVLNNGTTMQSGEIRLKSTAGNFQRGGSDTFEIDGYYGVVFKLQVANDKSNSSPNWLIDEITVDDKQRDRPRSTTFKVDSWLANAGSGTTMFLFSVVDGQYTPWSEWAACDTTCTCPTVCNGTQTRERTCNDPPPYQGGKSCDAQGPASENQPCQNFCVIDGGVSQWSTWSTCSEQCDTGQQNRIRTCTEPEPLNGGKECTETLFEEQDCNIQSCIVDGGVSEWADWSTCSKTCGTGVQTRTRTCTNPVPQNGGLNCTDDLLEEPRDCNTTPCPKVDGGVSEWDNWSTCSKTCGTGVQTRTRTCTNPVPLNGGLDCTDPLEEPRDCNTEICPDPGDSGYTPWSEWTTCSATCGGGRRIKTRTCRNEDRTNCAGRAVVSELCNYQACVDGNGSYVCGLDLWLCTGGDQCINSWERCDDRRHCLNGGDEIDCETDPVISSASLAIPIIIILCILIFIIAMVILVWCLIKRNRKRAHGKVKPGAPTSIPNTPSSVPNDSPDRGSYYSNSGVVANAPLILPPAKTARLQSTTVTGAGYYNYGNTETPYIINLPGNETVSPGTNATGGNAYHDGYNEYD